MCCFIIKFCNAKENIIKIKKVQHFEFCLNFFRGILLKHYWKNTDWFLNRNLFYIFAHHECISLNIMVPWRLKRSKQPRILLLFPQCSKLHNNNANIRVFFPEYSYSRKNNILLLQTVFSWKLQLSLLSEYNYFWIFSHGCAINITWIIKALLKLLTKFLLNFAFDDWSLSKSSYCWTCSVLKRAFYQLIR